jgi:hypothetical protein
VPQTRAFIPNLHHILSPMLSVGPSSCNTSEMHPELTLQAEWMISNVMPDVENMRFGLRRTGVHSGCSVGTVDVCHAWDIMHGARVRC